MNKYKDLKRENQFKKKERKRERSSVKYLEGGLRGSAEGCSNTSRRRRQGRIRGQASASQALI